MGWIAPLVAFADGAVDCGSVGSSSARWSYVVSGVSSFATSVWQTSCHGGMGQRRWNRNIVGGGLVREAAKHGGAKELEQLLSCVNSRALDEVDLTENVAKLDRLPQSHGILEVTDAYGSSVAANPRALSLSKYLDLATLSKESMYSLKGMSSPLPPVVIYMFLHRSFPPVGVVSAHKGEKNSFTCFCGINLYGVFPFCLIPFALIPFRLTKCAKLPFGLTFIQLTLAIIKMSRYEYSMVR